MARPRNHRRELDLDGSRTAPKGDNLFAWTVFILLLIGFVFLCWIGSFYVFGHPEEAFSYDILKKLKKVEAPKRFEITAAPRGEFLTADKLLERFGNLTPRELQKRNQELLRGFVRNYKLHPELVPYVVGSFQILDSWELQDDDLIQSGVVALLQSVDHPQLLVEHLYPAEEKAIPLLHRSLITGRDLPLVRIYDLSAVIHAEKLKDGRIKLTAIPLTYSEYQSDAGPDSFSLEPPADLNLQSGLPVVSDKMVEQADLKYTSHRKRAGLDIAGAVIPPSTGSLVRVQKPEPVNTTPASVPPAPVPEPTVARAIPVASAIPVAPAVPVTALEDATASIPVAPAVPATAEDGVPLQPFISPSPTPAAALANVAGGNWPVYSPGQLPPGRVVSPSEVRNMSGRPAATDRVYLQGDFLVTAAGNNRAVLRSSGGSSVPGVSGDNVRVIVEFPRGQAPPQESSVLNRDSSRPFLVTDIRKTPDGMVNVYVREIVQP